MSALIAVLVGLLLGLIGSVFWTLVEQEIQSTQRLSQAREILRERGIEL